MKKYLSKLIFAILFVATTSLCAQAPNAFNYQAVLRNAGGDLITGQLVEMRFTVRNNSAGGAIQYRETQNLTPNEFGLVDHAIGTGTVVSGTFAGITWATGTKFLQVELNTGGGFVNLGAEKLNSVPFALYSNNPGPAGPQGPAGATGPQGPAGSANMSGTTNQLVKFTGATTGGNSQITDNGTNVGIGTSLPIQKLHVYGRMNVSNGVIQRGGAAITSTDDLGLYSRVAGNHLRIVTNSGAIQFFAEEGTSGIGGQVAFEIQANASSAFEDRWTQISVHENEPTFRSTHDNWGYLGHSGRRWFRAYVATYFGNNTSIQSISDKSLKTNITPLSEGMASLIKLRPVNYDFIPEKVFPDEDARRKMEDKDIYNQIGFIAQEFDEIFPVLTREIDQDGIMLKTVGYSGLIPVMVKGMQEQQAQIEAQQAQIEELRQLVLELSKK